MASILTIAICRRVRPLRGRWNLIRHPGLHLGTPSRVPVGHRTPGSRWSPRGYSQYAPFGDGAVSFGEGIIDKIEGYSFCSALISSSRIHSGRYLNACDCKPKSGRHYNKFLKQFQLHSTPGCLIETMPHQYQQPFCKWQRPITRDVFLLQRHQEFFVGARIIGRQAHRMP